MWERTVSPQRTEATFEVRPVKERLVMEGGRGPVMAPRVK